MSYTGCRTKKVMSILWLWNLALPDIPAGKVRTFWMVFPFMLRSRPATTSHRSFNYVPLPDSLLEALVEHAELFPDDILVRWTQEQDLYFEATLGQLRGG